jgi:hypothetical protein
LKYEQDLIKMEKYADGIYTFIIKRKFVRKLILNTELNKVVYTFMEVIHNKLMKHRYLNIMKEVATVKREKFERLENIRHKFAITFYNKSLITKGFKLIYDSYYVNKKLEQHYIKKMAKTRIKNAKRMLFDLIFGNYNYYIGRYKHIEKKVIASRKVRDLLLRLTI